MTRARALLLAAALVLGGATAAQAETTPRPAAPRHARAEKKKWPMSAERFRAEIEARIGRARERLERGIERRKLGAARAQARRQELFTAALHLRGKLAHVSQDGVVTRDEAREVRDLARQLGRGRR